MSRLVELSPFDSWQLVEQGGGIARVVWQGRDGPAITPVNYVVADGCLWFQTSTGSRLATEGLDTSVLVEVDEVDLASRQGWSVIVHGVAHHVDPGTVPEVLGELDIWPPGPHPVFVRVEPTTMTGRRVRALGS